jgi:hypothetical protein
MFPCIRFPLYDCMIYQNKAYRIWRKKLLPAEITTVIKEPYYDYSRRRLAWNL